MVGSNTEFIVIGLCVLIMGSPDALAIGIKLTQLPATAAVSSSACKTENTQLPDVPEEVVTGSKAADVEIEASVPKQLPSSPLADPSLDLIEFSDQSSSLTEVSASREFVAGWPHNAVIRVFAPTFYSPDHFYLNIHSPK